MSNEFAPPAGSPGGLDAAANGLMRVAADIDTQNTATKHAVATAITQWHAPRANDFTRAGAGLQVELTLATTAIERVAGLVSAYSKALAQTQLDIASYSHQADVAQQATKNAPATQVDGLLENASRVRGQMIGQADSARRDLATLAARIAAHIDAETDLAVPNSAGLSPTELRRRVDASMGVTGLAGAADAGTLTGDQAWAALAAAQKAVPADAVGADGEVDWSKAVAEFNDKYVSPIASAGGIGAAPTEGWALFRLVQNQRETAADAVALRTAFSEIVGPVAHDLDNGLASLTDLNDALIRFRAGADASDVFRAARTTEVINAAKAGGLPEAGAIGALGKLGAGIGVFGDLLTLYNPGVENKTEGVGLRVTAAANIAGTGMALSATLLGVNAVADWIPVAGQVVMVATGLILAGDYAYHHWDQISNFVTNTAPHAVATAAKATGHAIASGAKAVGHFVSNIF